MVWSPHCNQQILGSFGRGAIYWFELACKDAFKSKLFKDIKEMLLRLYCLYENSPKKSRELQEIVSDLQQVFELSAAGID